MKRTQKEFQLVADFQPTGDQPQAIETLVNSIKGGNRYQTLLGVTGSGKTFTMANTIQRLQRPTLVICHNKTLAAQLYSEFKSFFPNNAVEYFVSYYDYYQPEAYLPQTDTHIEKDSSTNPEIERHRIAATSSLINRTDVIVVASVSCIYGLGSPEDFEALIISLEVNKDYSRDTLLEQLVKNQYNRSDSDLVRSTFRVRGEVIDIFPADCHTCIRVEFWGDHIESITEWDPETGDTLESHKSFNIHPTTQYITVPEKIEEAIPRIQEELKQRIQYFEETDRLIEAQRLKMRTDYDMEMLQELGFCSGIENYSMHLSGRPPGSRPWCLIDFFPKDFLLFVDESHATLPQVFAMYRGDQVRKQRLVEYGFRLPSAIENRPLQPEEFSQVTGQTLYISATPAQRELDLSTVVAEQLIRPTGLLDPIMEIVPIKGQVEHLMGEIAETIANGDRILVTTLTKLMSEDLAIHMRKLGIRVEYLHSDVNAIERVEILRHLREGLFDVLVGVNLLREGLDLPEVALVAILDADKEGFLRSETSIMQTAGRAARHEKGRVILYADTITKSIQRSLDTTKYRREQQIAYNEKHGITPKSVKRATQSSLHVTSEMPKLDPISLSDAHGNENVAAVLAELETEMLQAADKLDFERAALLRDQIDLLKSKEFS